MFTVFIALIITLVEPENTGCVSTVPSVTVIPLNHRLTDLFAIDTRLYILLLLMHVASCIKQY